jgi:hypothetical protein
MEERLPYEHLLVVRVLWNIGSPVMLPKLLLVVRLLWNSGWPVMLPRLLLVVRVLWNSD